MAGSRPNLHTMAPRRTCIQGVLNVKVEVPNLPYTLSVRFSSAFQWAINGSAKRKKIAYRKTQKKNIENANSTMNVSANSYNRNTNDYVELACLLLLSTTAGV